MSAAAIATWTLSWSAVREEFRTRLRGLHLAPWWEHARLLRVMPCSHGYAWNIQSTYNQRRGTNLLLSPLDWLLLEQYAAAGIPLSGIERGVHFMFDRRDRALQFGNREINSLSYCNQAILRETKLMNEAAVGSHCNPWESVIPRAHTLLLAVPPAGRMTFAAMQSERQVDRVAEIFQVGIIFTVYPEAWQKAQALERFNVHLDFLDPESQSLSSTHGSRLAESSRRGYRQPFLNQEVNG
jgi:hypothetical protein